MAKHLSQHKELESLDKLKNKFFSADPWDQGLIKDLEKRVIKGLLVLDLKEHQGFKYFLKVLDDRQKVINNRLVDEGSDTLPDAKRDRLIDERAWIKSVFGLFDISAIELKQANDEVEENLRALEIEANERSEKLSTI